MSQKTCSVGPIIIIFIMTVKKYQVYEDDKYDDGYDWLDKECEHLLQSQESRLNDADPSLRVKDYEFAWIEDGKGVWVWKRFDLVAHQTCAGVLEKKYKVPAMLHNALSMDERAGAIERMGGTFYPNYEDCPVFEKIV